jgi:hypothetical protein
MRARIEIEYQWKPDDEKTERIRCVLDGELADRVPYSVWTHFPGIDLDPDRLAEATLAFYRDLDLDFLKNMSNGMFSIEDLDATGFSALGRRRRKRDQYAVEAPRLGDVERTGY